MTTPVPFQSLRARLTLRWTLAVGVLLGVANVAVYASASLYLARWLDGHVRTVAATEAAPRVSSRTRPSSGRWPAKRRWRMPRSAGAAHGWPC